jgi:hypothetical protein
MKGAEHHLTAFLLASNSHVLCCCLHENKYSALLSRSVLESLWDKFAAITMVGMASMSFQQLKTTASVRQ